MLVTVCLLVAAIGLLVVSMFHFFFLHETPVISVSPRNKLMRTFLRKSNAARGFASTPLYFFGAYFQLFYFIFSLSAFHSCRHRPASRFRDEALVMQDGGTITLKWILVDDDDEPEPGPTTPVLLWVPDIYGKVTEQELLWAKVHQGSSTSACSASASLSPPPMADPLLPPPLPHHDPSGASQRLAGRDCHPPRALAASDGHSHVQPLWPH
jgi:hypothetical protein